MNTYSNIVCQTANGGGQLVPKLTILIARQITALTQMSNEQECSWLRIQGLDLELEVENEKRFQVKEYLLM